MKQFVIIFIALIFNCSQLGAVENLTDKTWTEAFEIIHGKVKTHYPFLEHKAINIDSLYQITRNEILQAEKTGNDTTFFIAMKKYAFALKDNHVFLRKKGFNPFANQMQGHYGFDIVKLDNGDIVVSQIRKEGKLQSQLKPGTKIISWNGIPIYEKIQSTSMLPAESMDATTQNQFIKKCELMMFGAMGETAQIEIEDNKGNRQFIEISISPSEKLKKQVSYPKISIWNRTVESPVDVDIFDDEQIGYLRINIFMPNLADFSLPETFRQKLWLLEKMKVKSLIIDLRGNQGGVDEWASKMAGHFVSSPKHYQYISRFNQESGQFEIDSSKTSIVKPRKPFFDKPVIILVDHKTASTGEGMPMVLQGLPNVKIAGQYNTCGVFATGFTDFVFKLPEDIVFGFLEGRSVNENGNIQVDADNTGKGGITPDIRIPVSKESVRSQFLHGEDYVLNQVLLMVESDI